MPGKTAQPRSPGLDVSLVINAPPGRVLKAFFDPDALGAWWQAARSVTTPRVLGVYAIEWASTDFEDNILGRLGGVFRGTVLQFDPGRGFLVADAFWLPPDGDPIGPMALEVTCSPVTLSEDATPLPVEIATKIRVVQSGFEDGGRWQRYYEVVSTGWERALASLKMLLEK
jgi:uncharacterized protein YndB with AHSA1/START domain